MRKPQLKTQEDDYPCKANQLSVKTPTKAVHTQLYKYTTLPHKKQARKNVKCMTGHVGRYFEIFQGSRQFILYFRGKVPYPDSDIQHTGCNNHPEEKISMPNIIL